MIREVTVADAHAICRIYNHYVLNTTISFEEAEVDDAAMAGRIAAATLPWFVHEEDGEVLAYAYATPWRARAAYRFAAESSVYVAAGATGRKLGLAIYRHLLDALRERGMQTVIGGVAQPNAASVALHEKLGFKKVAHFERVGWKQARWIDVGYWQLQLASPCL
jgi:phosphinothricin acetyltransferase